MEESIDTKIERLNALSKSHPVMPDEFIPWDNKIQPGEIYMPAFLFSLSGTGLENNLSDQQIDRLKKLEAAQIMSTYAYSETVGCLIFSEILLKVSPSSPEGKYLVNMMMEELRHQYMFTRTIELLGVEAQPVPFFHKMMANIFTRGFRKSSKYIVVLAIEQVADVYARYYRKDPEIYSVLRKVSELHHIEEGRHMMYQKICLDRYVNTLGFFKKTLVGSYYVFTVWFMRSQYIRRSFFVDIGVDDPDRYYKAAAKNYRQLFGKYCLKESIEYAESIGIINFLNKPLWRIILKAKV